MQTPSGVHSHVQWHIAKLHWQTQIPFIRQFTEQSPSQSDLQRFCNVAQASSSSQTQCSFAPPAHFSTRIVQRGTISVLPVVAAGLAAADIPSRHAVPTDRSSIIIPAIPGLLFGGGGPVGADIPRRVPPVDPDLRREGVSAGSNARERAARGQVGARESASTLSEYKPQLKRDLRGIRGLRRRFADGLCRDLGVRL